TLGWCRADRLRRGPQREDYRPRRPRGRGEPHRGRMRTRVGMGYDVHAFGGDGPLVLGGVVLEGRGLVGHSDADAVAHAVADAILGPADLPDLGTLFPADDDQWRGASSIELLRDV